MRAQKMLTGGLAAVCAGLAALTWHVATMPLDTRPIAPGEPVEAASGATALPALGALDARKQEAADYPETLARPLFRSNRRPLAPEAKNERDTPGASGDEAALPSGLQLVGILQQGGRRARALIRYDDAPAGRWIELGSTLSGWTLSRVEREGVTFKSAGSEHKLKLSRDRGQ